MRSKLNRSSEIRPENLLIIFNSTFFVIFLVNELIIYLKLYRLIEIMKLFSFKIDRLLKIVTRTLGKELLKILKLEKLITKEQRTFQE
jgi:hypothetical protein